MSKDFSDRAQVVVVDDDDNVRQSIEWTLRSVNLEVQSYASAQECLARCERQRPLCLVVDLLLPGMTGINLCEKLAAMHDCFKFVMITGYGDVDSAVLAMKLGAVDFLEKPVGRERLLQSVNRSLQSLQRREFEIGSEEEVAARFNSLTGREQEVFECVASGLVSKQIAKKLGISARTVDVHRSNIMKKLGVESPSQLGYLISILSRRQERTQDQA